LTTTFGFFLEVAKQGRTMQHKNEIIMAFQLSQKYLLLFDIALK
jgi:hypothetical protein